VTVHEVTCPGCDLRFEVDVVRRDEVCGAPLPTARERLCDLAPHADEEHDPEHETTGTSGARVRWRDSEFAA